MKQYPLSSSALRTNTLQRDKRAPLISNDGFSVVAPISIMLPFFLQKAKKASCWDLLKRCISSTNKIVFSPKDTIVFCLLHHFSYFFNTTCHSREINKRRMCMRSNNSCKCQFYLLLVVPRRSLEEIESVSMSLLSIFPFPTR